jgi:hypothetical protein
MPLLYLWLKSRPPFSKNGNFKMQQRSCRPLNCHHRQDLYLAATPGSAMLSRVTLSCSFGSVRAVKPTHGILALAL